MNEIPNPEKLKVSQQEDQQKEGQPLESKEKPKKRVLVIEDNEKNRETAKKFFNSGGIEEVDVEYAVDYAEAMKKLETEDYNVIISDFLLPEKTGGDDRELGIKTAFHMAELVQQKLIETGELKPREGKNEIPKIIEEDFRRLIEAVREIKLILDQKRNDPKIRKFLSYYETSGGEGEWLTDAITSSFKDNLKDLSLTEDKITDYQRVARKMSGQLGGWGNHLVQAAFDLVSEKNSYQPLGLRVIEKAREKNIKHLLFSKDEHGGFGSGLTQLAYLLYSDQEGRFVYGKEKIEVSDLESKKVPMQETVEFVIGDKTDERVWKIATQFLVEQKE